jgi:hypothetical protein
MTREVGMLVMERDVGETGAAIDGDRVRINAYIEKPLARLLAEAAKRDRRTISAEIAHILATYLEPERKDGATDSRD